MRFLGFILIAACTVDPMSVGAPFNPQGAPLERGAALDEIRFAEDHRLGGNTKLLGHLATSQDPVVLVAALTAAGRIADPHYASLVTSHLGHQEASVRAAAVGASVRLQTGADALVARLAIEEDSHVLGTLLDAVGALALMQAQPKVEAYLSSPNADVLAGAASAWAALIDAATPSTPVLRTLLQCTSSAGREAVYCANALRVAAKKWNTLDTLLPFSAFTAVFDKLTRVEVRYALLGPLRRYTGGKARLQALTQDASVTMRVGAFSGLAALEADISAGLTDTSAAVRQTTLSLLKAPFDSTRLETMALHDASPWVRAEAIATLAKFDPNRAVEVGLPSLTADAGPINEAVINSLAAAGRFDRLFDLFNGDRHAVGAYAGTALSSAALKNASLGNALAVAVNDPTSDRLLAVGAIAKMLNDAATLTAMATLYPSLSTVETLGADLRLAVAQYATDISVLKMATQDSQRQVAEQAAATLKALSGEDISVRINSEVDDVTPSTLQIEAIVQQRVALQTTRGEITVRLLTEEAPITAYKFLGRVKAGFYDGLTFHRVVPGFVAQGGDPTATGSGSAAKFVRDEYSRAGHRRGTLGIATSGRDTGSCQFFFNLVDNAYLDAGYTVFAEIESGIDVAEAIERGDSIVRASLVTGADTSEK